MITVAKMYRTKLDGTRYSKPTKTFRDTTVEALLEASRLAGFSVEFADETGATIDLEPTPEPAPEPKKSKPADLDKIEKRIVALMAQADSTNHPGEAAVFYAKAEELMLQYAVDRARLEEVSTNGKRKPEEEILVVRVAYGQVKERWKALGVFGSAALSDAMGLTGLAINNRSQHVTLYGREADIRHVRTILEAAWRQAEQQLKVWRKSDPAYKNTLRRANETGDWAWYYKMLDGFVLGFCEGAAAKIRDTRQTFVESTPGSELVLASVKDKVDAALGELKQSRAWYPGSDAIARENGFQAGLKANLVAELA